MNAVTTGRRNARGKSGARELVNSLVDRAMVLTKERPQTKTKRVPTLKERQQDLVIFNEKYEDLVEALCESAQYGPVPRLEKQYADCRVWVQGHYADVRPFVAAYLRYESEDDAKCDAFEALVAPDSLSDLLRADDGGMISRITRTREALNLYGEHLRQLASKSAV